MRRAAIIVLDGLGIGEAPDTASYGDAGSDTLGNVARAVGGLRLPRLAALGLGRCAEIAGLDPVASPAAAFGSCEPRSAGKDSTTGHWELCGLVLESPFPTYPDGFPAAVLDEFARRTGRGVLGNVAASGTAILETHGEEHLRTGRWIVYTSADSVFQVAAHESIVPVEELYSICRTARKLLDGKHAVGRVIARPFTGEPGSFRRTTARRDFPLVPPEPTLLDHLASSGRRVITVGKIDEMFGGRGITRSHHVATNRESIHEMLACLEDEFDGRFFGIRIAHQDFFDGLVKNSRHQERT